MRRNELKAKILRLLESGSATPMEVQRGFSSQGLKIRIGSVRMALLRYYRWGLVVRKPAHRRKKGFVYSISNRGKSRLDWLMKTTRA